MINYTGTILCFRVTTFHFKIGNHPEFCPSIFNSTNYNRTYRIVDTKRSSWKREVTTIIQIAELTAPLINKKSFQQSLLPRRSLGALHIRRWGQMPPEIFSARHVHTGPKSIPDHTANLKFPSNHKLFRKMSMKTILNIWCPKN